MALMSACSWSEMMWVWEDQGTAVLGAEALLARCWCRKSPELLQLQGKRFELAPQLSANLCRLCLKDVYAVAKIASENLVSVGASLAHVHVPGRSHSSDELDQSSDIEVGMGIHNEEGFGKMQADLVAVVKTMLAQLLDTSDKDRGFIHIRAADPVILLVNNLGGVSPLELGAIVDEIWLQLDCDYSLQPMRILTGTFMTSLNGLGFSISILKLADTGLGAGKSLLDLIDAPAEVTGWAAAVRPYSWLQSRVKKSTAQKTIRGNESTDGADGAHGTVSSNLRLDPQLAERVLRSGLQRVIDGEPEITRFDTIVGDGDCGTGIKRGATAVLNYLSQPTPADAVRLVSDLCHVVESNMDGTSGAIYSIFLNALTGALASQDVGSHTITMVDAQMWARALSAALESLGKYTPARPGDRTLVDALDPFVRAMEAVGDFKEAATAAEKGSESTQGMEASLGRSVYVGGEAFKTCPDPGAYALSLLLLGMSQAV